MAVRWQRALRVGALGAIACAAGCTQILGAEWDGRAPDDGASADGGAPGAEAAAANDGGAPSGRDGASSGAPGPASAAMGLGALHSCAVDVEGRVLCWGNNVDGEAGIPIATAYPATAHVVTMPEKATAAAGGFDFTIVLGASGAVFSFGDDMDGTLARPLPTAQVVDDAPGKVLGLTEAAVALAAHGEHACVVLVSGKVACWGNGFAAAGSGDRPALVAGLAAPARGVAVGASHACALLDGGGVVCWGSNDQRQLGVDTTESSAAPIAVPLARRAIGVVAGDAHACALLDDGSGACWGANAHGQLGPAAKGLARSVPVAVAGLAGATSLAAGDEHTCARTGPAGAAKVICWGNADDGRLGGTPVDAGALVEVFGLPGTVDAVGAGRRHTCVRLGAGGAMCWGANDYSQLGNGDASNKTKGPAPRAVENW